MWGLVLQLTVFHLRLRFLGKGLRSNVTNKFIYLHFLSFKLFLFVSVPYSSSKVDKTKFSFNDWNDFKRSVIARFRVWEQ